MWWLVVLSLFDRALGVLQVMKVTGIRLAQNIWKVAGLSRDWPTFARWRLQMARCRTCQANMQLSSSQSEETQTGPVIPKATRLCWWAATFWLMVFYHFNTRSDERLFPFGAPKPASSKACLASGNIGDDDDELTIWTKIRSHYQACVRGTLWFWE